MKIIGLTGGIASGKSTVAKKLAQLGAYVIDADKVAHMIIEPYKPAWYDIVEEFGEEVLNADKTVNRERLGKIVFNNPDLLQKLNNITHPRIMEFFKEEIQRLKAEKSDSVIVLEVPLLYETHMDRICDEVWVVWVDYETQIERLCRRDKISVEDAVKRISAQMPLDEKARRAKVVIDNRHSLEETMAKTVKYFNEIVGDP
ncbi:dephospho-CoA kinase [Thermosyntropha lipolytica DSM 11003]|uniref:Dephospho-CoA kinase n=1 Tax=Thermosyntropha lipolytica DSM 11003 TaxID=1123382 RepID=A0A1M5MZP9_9FIRM|nr:dephospho-CoA kinase [Thermosyntropha lipolytica]SHG82707.1 dephospho-CoA kinase [Thermosyntropha lipolytica DSM 11003]